MDDFFLWLSEESTLHSIELANADLKEGFLKLIAGEVNHSLDIYLNAINNKATEQQNDELLKIDELAKLTKESNSTIRHWTKKVC